MKSSKRISKRLKGKDLADYIKNNKSNFKENGDDLCLAAGYGKTTENGATKCDLPLFIKEASEAMQVDL
tara:strand:+ start:956 stop:1162 length:207 start_codon:yes stop_codon:yes gene_type:complete